MWLAIHWQGVATAAAVGLAAAYLMFRLRRALRPSGDFRDCENCPAAGKRKA